MDVLQNMGRDYRIEANVAGWEKVFEEALVASDAVAVGVLQVLQQLSGAVDNRGTAEALDHLNGPAAVARTHLQNLGTPHPAQDAIADFASHHVVDALSGVGGQVGFAEAVEPIFVGGIEGSHRSCHSSLL